jgi:DNA polymerase elongation subunit (family B)
MLKTKRRRLFFDIETSYCVGWFWRPGSKIFIPSSNILRHAAIICICYKWEDEKEVYSLRWDAKQNDKKALEKFVKVANQADELVGHNSDKFDLAWIRTRCAFHRLDMFPTYATIDTLKVSRSKFRFPDNKLNTIATYLGIGKKIKTTDGLWGRVVEEKCEKSMQEMIKYCKGDVTLLERVFNHLKGHMEPKTHYGVIFGGDRGSCPECGSDDLKIIKRRVSAAGLKKIQYQCKTCNRHCTKTDK